MTAPPGGSADPFPRRLTWALAAVGSICLVGSMVSLILPSDRPDETAKADSTSRSALGHRALVDLLRDQDIPVVVSRHETARRTSDASLLLVIEPQADQIGTGGAKLSALVRDARCPVLVVLPKWRAIVFDSAPDRLEDVARLTPLDVMPVISALDRGAGLVSASADAPQWIDRTPDSNPAIVDPQLVDAPGWQALIRTDRGVLAAKRGGEYGPVALLADPDLIANHGLHRQPNAGIAVDLVRGLRSGTRPVLLDETLHGLAVPSSFWAQLLQFPLGLATIQAALAAAIFLWAGMRRFGPPLPAPLPFEPGKSFLIAHTTRLLEAGGHHAESLAGYAALVAEEAARHLHSDARKSASDKLGGLESEVAGVTRGPGDARAVLRVARRLARLRQEIVHGSHVRTDTR